MYAALVNYPVKGGYLDEAIRLWREEVEPAAEGQPGYEGSVLLVEPASNRLVVVAYWDTKAHDDAFATAGPWRAGSELRNKIDVLLSEEPSRVEMEVAYLNAPEPVSRRQLHRLSTHKRKKRRSPKVSSAMRSVLASRG